MVDRLKEVDAPAPAKTTPERWLELAERCRTAEGPSGMLNFNLAEALGLVSTGGLAGSGTFLPYSESVDAAATLAPPACTALTVHWKPGGSGGAQVYIGDTCFVEDGATPALALCAACCLARASG